MLQIFSVILLILCQNIVLNHELFCSEHDISVLGEGNEIIEYTDGSREVILENGWTITKEADGTIIYAQQDGFEEIRYPTGAGRITYPNGNIVYSFLEDHIGECSVTIKSPVECDIYGNVIDGNLTAESENSANSFIEHVPMITDEEYLHKLSTLSPYMQAQQITQHLFDKIVSAIRVAYDLKQPVDIKFIVADCVIHDITKILWESHNVNDLLQEKLASDIIGMNYEVINSLESPLSHAEKQLLAHINVNIACNNLAHRHNMNIEELLNKPGLYQHLFTKQFNSNKTS